MQPMMHTPGAVGIGSEVVANGARGLAAGTAANGVVAAQVPAGADEVSAMAAVSFAVDGAESTALNAFAQQELARAGAAVVEISGIYNAVDEANATILS